MCSAQSQWNKYILKINSSQGLSHNVVYDIKQDNHGFIWIATQDGLNRYDGYGFKVFKFNPEDSTSISDNYIKSIYFDAECNLWISTRYGLNLFNPANNSFRQFQFGTGGELDITKIIGSSYGGLWIGNYLGGVYYFDPVDTLFRLVTPPEHLQYPVMTVMEDKTQKLWIGTGGQGVIVYNLEHNKAVTDSLLTSEFTRLRLKFIETIFSDYYDNIWIGTHEGLILYKSESGEIFRFLNTSNQNSIGGDIILDINQDSKGNLLIGTQEGGLSVLSADQIVSGDPSDYKFERLIQGTDNYNLSYRSVQAVFEDRDKNIWLGTYGNGLNLIPFSQPKFDIIRYSSNTPGYLSLDKVWGMCEDNEGFLWIGTDGMGLNKIEPKSGRVSHYTSGTDTRSLSDNAVLSALCDSRGRLWFGTYAGGLNLFDVETRSFLNVNLNIKDETNLVKDIRCIFEDSDGIIWIGTNGNGLRKLNPENLSVEAFFPMVADYSSTDIRAITQDNNGILWLGTYGGGLVAFDPDSKTAARYAFDRFSQGTLKCNIIYALQFDKERDCLWIGGSQYGGLNKFDLSTRTFTVYDEKHGLSNNNIHAIAADFKGRIWVSTNTGISLFMPEETKFINYNRLDGVQAKEFSDGSVIKSKYGNLIYFGGSDGLNYFDPEKIGISTDTISVLITEINVLTRPEIRKSVLDGTNQSSPGKVILEHTQNVFSIGFSGIYYSNPEKITYQYKLEEEDQNWINLGNLQSVTFRNLKPGSYNFMVRASNEDGVWSEIYDSLEIIIKPPFWKTWWAYAGYTLLFVIIVLWVYFYNLKEAKIRHSLIMEKKMRVQEHEMNEEKLNFFTNISHEIRTPLMLLLNPLEDLVTKESRNTELGRTLNSMYRSANSLLQLINMLLEFRKMEKGKLVLNPAKKNIVEQIKENCIAFKGLVEKKKISLSFTSEKEEISVWFDKDKLEMIINNLLSNAVRSTGINKNIHVSIKTKKEKTDSFPNGSLIIEVKDEGKGIPADKLDKIFEMFYQVRGFGESGGTGIGLTLTKKLVELHKGTIEVVSELNKGTTFTVNLPLGDAHLSELEKSGRSLSGDPSHSYIQSSNIDLTGKALDKIATLSKDKKKILVIEDDDEIRAYFCDLLKDYFIIDHADNGLTGLEKVRNFLPNLVISDIMMPGIDGVELCRTIKSDIATSHIPVLLITASVSHHIHIDSMEVGADAYITKPFKPDLLISRIYNLLISREKLRDYYISKLRDGFIPEDKSMSRDEEFLMSVYRIINRNLENSDFSITQLHEELLLSRTLFYNKIKSLTNYSPIELIRQIRLRKAADLLLTKKYKVFEVMIKVGFNDEKHFRQLFKNQYGVTPTEYQLSGTHSVK